MKHTIVKTGICAAAALSCAFAFSPAAFAVMAVAPADGAVMDDTADTGADTTPGDDSGEVTPPVPAYTAKIKKGYTFTAGNATYKVAAAPKVKTSTSANADGTQAQTFKFTGKVELVSYKGSKKASVPAQVKAPVKKTANSQGDTFAESGTFDVASIAKGAFDNSKGHKVTSVSIGKNVASIGDKAFYGCKKLTKITLKGDALRTVGANSDKSLNRKSSSYVKKLYKLRSKKWKNCKVFTGVPRTCSITLPNINASKGLKYNIEYANAVRLLTGSAGYVGVVK